MTEKFELNPLNSGSALPIELKTNSTALTDLVDDLFGERIYLKRKTRPTTALLGYQEPH